MTAAAQGANLNFDSEEHPYEVPTKKIVDMNAMLQFQSSAGAMDLTMFIVECQKAVKNTKMTQTPLSDRIKPLHDWLDKIELWLNEVPPLEQEMRFGNKAFRTWLDKIKDDVDVDLGVIMQAGNPNFKHYQRAIVEVKEYLLDSFGSYERIDYGTGHELNFYVFLYCMCKLGIYTVNDYEVLINKVFNRYIQVMRRL